MSIALAAANKPKTTNAAQTANKPAQTTVANPPAQSTNAPGIVVNDHPVARNFLRWGGVAALVGGAAMAGYSFLSRHNDYKGSWQVGAAIAGVAGATMFGTSFLGGLQPKKLPFEASGLASENDALAKATSLHRSTAVYEQSPSSYALVDFSPRDFDHEDRSSINLGNKNIKWSALVTRDGDVLRQAAADPNSYRDIGRVDPPPLQMSTLKTPADVAKLSGVQFGTTNAHQPVSLGAQLGDPKGYGAWADAAAAAYKSPGDTAIVQALGRNFLFAVSGTADGTITTVAARGASLAPVNVVNVQEGLKIYQAGGPGQPEDFRGRATPFNATDPIGYALGGDGIRNLLGTSDSPQAAARAIENDNMAIDRVFNGGAGEAILTARNPDGSSVTGTYLLGGGGGRGEWDEELAPDQGVLERTVQNRRDTQEEFWYDENSATLQYEDYRKVNADLTGPYGGELRTTGWRETDSGIDWGASMARRNQLREERIQREQEAERERQQQQQQQQRTSTGDSPPAGTSTGDSPSHSNPDNSGPGNPGFQLTFQR
jgi:hypothetical protein